MESLEILTKSASETQKLGKKLALKITREVGLLSLFKKTAVVISLEGELGAGKTTFTQGFAKGLGIKDKIQSPTFIILKIYKISKKAGFKNFIHVDAYRLRARDFGAFGWKKFISDPKNVILVEWGNKIKNILPKNSLVISFGHIGHKNKRLITIK